jgi:hypothetical protein
MGLATPVTNVRGHVPALDGWPSVNGDSGARWGWLLAVSSVLPEGRTATAGLTMPVTMPLCAQGRTYPGACVVRGPKPTTEGTYASGEASHRAGKSDR